MEELKKSLDALLENTKELENVKLQQSNSQVVDDLIARKRSRIVRDATPYEQQIAEYCMNTEPYLEKVKADLRQEDPEKVLSTARMLNQICRSYDIKERIEILEQNLKESLININYLEEARAKNEIEIDQLTRSNTEQNMHNMDEDTEGESSVIDELRAEQLEVQRLKQELARKRLSDKEQAARKQDHLRTYQQLIKLQERQSFKLKQGTAQKVAEKIANLEQEIRVKTKRLAEYDAMIDNLAENQMKNSKRGGGASKKKAEQPKQATILQLHFGLRARVEKLLNSPPGNDNDESINTSKAELLSTFQSLEADARDILTRLEAAEKAEDLNEKTRYIYRRLTEHVHHLALKDLGEEEQKVNMEEFNALFEHNKHENVPDFNIPKETLLSTAILLKLFDQQQSEGGDLPLASLDAYVQQIAKQHHISEEEEEDKSSQAIYTLSASGLVSIDRSHKDSLVKLNLTTPSKK